MKRYNRLKILPLLLTIIISQRSVFAGDVNHQKEEVYLSDSIKNRITKGERDSLNIDSSLIRKIYKKNILSIINGVDTSRRIISWRLNPTSYDLEPINGIDTSVFFPHLLIPSQKHLETFTSLGNLGAPLQADHFFSRESNDFLFSRFYEVYIPSVADHKYFYVRKPLTLISYTSGGGSRIGELSLRAIHSQNVNKYLNFGLTYDHYGTKGIYKNQTTKDNFFTLFASYYKDRFSVQGTVSYSRIRNNENGGLESDYFIQDTTLEPALIPFKLTGASSEVKKKSFSGILGYAIINRWVSELDSKGSKVLIKKPVFSLKALFDASKQTRTYSDTSTSYYENYYISKGATHDSTMILLYQSTVLAEFEQLAKFPGLPGVRFWITNTSGKYYYFKPSDFLFKRKDDRITTAHFGVGIFSYSPYLSYNGSLRMYLNGYRASDKELIGQMVISPWKTEEYPYVKAKIEISDKESDIFLKNYFSNHFKWENNFEKEKRFLLGGSIGADKWRFEAGYNLVRINDFIYFDITGIPKQASGVTITSAFVQKEFKLGHFYSTNRVVWQAYDNKEAINLPTFSIFSSLFFEVELVKKVLTARIGTNVFFRTKFYADAFSPATGQFYNQKVKKIGDYPVIDAFVDFKWKRAVLFVKYDHINQGMPNNEYFSALHYPLNHRIFKFGVSWIFYD
ncbi:MAG: hypothetical protein EHM93_17620 [Bacteroidales bacterium]|nr:MAG: hypothetical protein EHM93_17620 [Bacteroidales bacterium]